MSSDITAAQGLVVAHDTAMIDELFSVMGMLRGVHVSIKHAPDDKIYPLLNKGLGEIGKFHFGSGIKSFVDGEAWADRGNLPLERDCIQPSLLPKIDACVSLMMLESVEEITVGLYPIVIRPGVFSSSPGIVSVGGRGRKAEYFLTNLRLDKLLRITPDKVTEHWNLLNSLQGSFGAALPVIPDEKPKTLITYQTRESQITVTVECGSVSSLVDAVIDVDNYILHQQAMVDALDFMGATRLATAAPEVTPEYVLSDEERLAVLRKTFPSWGTW